VYTCSKKIHVYWLLTIARGNGGYNVMEVTMGEGRKKERGKDIKRM
jgi:hypothetical protein